jgi:hypothetical protein
VKPGVLDCGALLAMASVRNWPNLAEQRGSDDLIRHESRAMM